MNENLTDIATVVASMGIKTPSNVLLAKIGKEAVARYREKYCVNPKKIPIKMGRRTHNVYGYEKKDYLLVLEAAIHALEMEFYRMQDLRKNTEMREVLAVLKSLEQDYSLVMLGVLHQVTWEKLSQVMV